MRPRIHTFLATSDIHMEHKLRMTRDEVLETVGDMVQYARSLCSDVEFSPEDAGRSDPEFLVKVLEVAIQAGATTLNIPDTVGYTTPEEYGGLIRYLRENVPGGKDVIFSVPLPQRPGAGHGQHAGRRAERRAPDRGDDQRHRRARRQHQPGRDGHGAARAAADLSTWTPTSSPTRSTAPATW